MGTPRICKDCVTEFGGFPPPARQARPAPHPGPRCATHHRLFVKAGKAVAAEKKRQRRFGLAPGDYDRLYAFQGRCCFICRKATGKSKRLAVDHCHTTGRVRGLLCGPCNRLIGIAESETNGTAMFYRAIEYLGFPPAQWLGIDARKEVPDGDATPPEGA